MHNERLLYLFLRRKSGDITLEEQLELSELIKTDADAPLFIDGMQDVFGSALSYSKNLKNSSVEKALSLAKAKIAAAAPQAAQGAKYRKLRVFMAAASILLVFIATAFYLVNRNSADKDTGNIVTTKKGSKTNLVLPDGTKVWVNADSKLSYGEDFGATTRDVYLTGEAYFDVTKNEKKPFIVHTGTMDIRVLGTVFNVRAYESEDNAQTTLLRGSVEVLLKNNKDKKLLLSPNEKIVIRKEPTNKTIDIHIKALPQIELSDIRLDAKDSSVAETQWVQNRLVFNEETLAQIVPVLERWYNVTIVLEKIKRPGLLYRGAFENDSLEDVLASLQMIGRFKYRIQKDKVFIY